MLKVGLCLLGVWSGNALNRHKAIRPTIYLTERKNHFRCSDAPSREYWGHNGDPGELRTQFRVHQAATEVVFLKANFTLLNYLEAWVSSYLPPVLSEVKTCPRLRLFVLSEVKMCPHLNFLFVMEMCPHLHFLPELEMCPHLCFSSHVWEGLCPA